MDLSSLSPLYLLPLVGGYVFSVTWLGSAYEASRESGHKLYFRAVFYGVLLYTMACLLHIKLFISFPGYYDFLRFTNDSLARTPMSSIWSKTSQEFIFIGSFCLGPLLAYALNIPVHFNRNKLTDIVLEFKSSLKEEDPAVNLLYWLLLVKGKIGQWYVTFFLNRAIKNNDFEILLSRAIYRNMPVMLTLDTGKLYVGWIVRIPNPVEYRKAVRILPMLSGYRDKDTHDVVFTQNYYDILEDMSDGVIDALKHLEIDDFEVVLPYERIISSHLFDPEAYMAFINNNNSKNPDNANL